MPGAQEANMSELFDQAVETFGGAMRAGVKFQEDMAQWWNDALEQIGSVQQWQKKSTAVMSEAIPTAQKSADEYMRVFDQSYHSSMDLLKKAFESVRTGSMTERAARTENLWETSMQTMRNNTQAMAQANVRVMESWADFLKRNMETGMPARMNKKAEK